MCAHVFLKVTGRLESLRAAACRTLVRFLARMDSTVTLQRVARCERFAADAEAAVMWTIASVGALMHLGNTHMHKLLLSILYFAQMQRNQTDTKNIHQKHRQKNRETTQKTK